MPDGGTDGPRTQLRTVIICDQRRAARSALSVSLVRHSPAVEIVLAHSADLVEAFSSAGADLVFIGMGRGAPGGHAAAGRLLQGHRTAKVIAYGSIADSAVLTAAVSDGASGLMLWNPTPGLRGPIGVRMSTVGSTGRRSRPPASNDMPTDREMQVLRALSEGRSNREIGQRLKLSEETVKTVASRLFRNLGVRDRAHAVAVGFRQGLVS